MNKIFSQKDILKNTPDIRGKKVLVGGCFDVIHRGHIEFLDEAKRAGDVLIAFLEGDETIARLKGKGRPIHNQEDRAHILSHLTNIDFVILLDNNLSDSDYSKLVKVLKPDIIALTKGDPITELKREYAKSIGGSVVIIAKKGHYSTKNIVKKIKNL